MSVTAPTGMVVLVGAGPGDVQLLSLAGNKWITTADVLVYDRLAPAELLSRARPDAERIYAGKGRGNNAMNQDAINALLVEQAKAGKLVVRLKGGDPFIFGRGGEEAQACRDAGVPFRVVPGVTAAVAGAAYAGIPLTDRRLAGSVALVTGQEAPSRGAERINFAALAGVDTVVFYMGVKNLPTIAERLLAAGKPPSTPAAIIERATTARQRTIRSTLAEIPREAAAANVAAPALIIVGEVCALAGALAWRDALPLAGRTVLVTRARAQASRLSNRLRDLGAEVIEAPTIDIRPPADWTAVDAALRRIGTYDTVCLTSPNGVETMVARMRALGLDGRALAGVRLAAVGSSTAAAMHSLFLRADITPETFTAEALGETLTALGDLNRSRVLLLRADIARPRLAEILTAAGAEVDDVALYRTVRPARLAEAAAEALAERRVDWITFTSSSTVTNFFELARPILEPLGGAAALASAARAASIGPVTSETLVSRGFPPAVEAVPHTIEGLADTVVRAEQAGSEPA